MQLTAPVTDYVRASLMTTGGDMVRRNGTDPVRLARPVGMNYLAGFDADTYPQWRTLGAGMDTYFKNQGGGAWPIWEALALRDTGIRAGFSTRNAGGAQVIVGAGFEPSTIIFIASESAGASLDWSVGWSGAGSDMCLYGGNSGGIVEIRSNRCMNIDLAGANSLDADVTSFDADGFTLNWTLAGAVNVEFCYLCLP